MVERVRTAKQKERDSRLEALLADIPDLSDSFVSDELKRLFTGINVPKEAISGLTEKTLMFVNNGLKDPKFSIEHMETSLAVLWRGLRENAVDVMALIDQQTGNQADELVSAGYEEICLSRDPSMAMGTMMRLVDKVLK